MLDDAPNASPFFTIAEDAAYARRGPRTIRRWMQAGDLRRCGRPSRPLVLRAELEALLAPREGEAEAE